MTNDPPVSRIEIDDFLQNRFEHFYQWCTQHWMSTPQDWPSAEEQRGWDAAIESLPAALECYREVFDK
ncbi:MAG: hypothetical protein AAF205_00180 [Pseudomonadota bacterium]